VHRGDGYGIERLRERGVPMLVLSRERDGVVGARCRKLRIDVEQASDDKLPVLRHWAEARGVDLADVVYVGNDLNDQECLAAVGGPVIVADAHPSVFALASVVLPVRGGDGAARAVADLVMERLDRSLAIGEKDR
jgi:YrbI family 3-deoxy-D-manno-octulosonate 8-phosphate phosphatase